MNHLLEPLNLTIYLQYIIRSSDRGFLFGYALAKHNQGKKPIWHVQMPDIGISCQNG